MIVRPPTLFLLQDKVKALFGRYEVIVHNWRNIMGHALVLEFTPAAALVKVWKGRVWGGVGRDEPGAETAVSTPAVLVTIASLSTARCVGGASAWLKLAWIAKQESCDLLSNGRNPPPWQ